MGDLFAAVLQDLELLLYNGYDRRGHDEYKVMEPKFCPNDPIRQGPHSHKKRIAGMLARPATPSHLEAEAGSGLA